MKIINSASNEIIKDTIKLRNEGFFWWEGFNFYQEIINTATEVERIFVVEDFFRNKLGGKITVKCHDVFLVSNRVFDKLSFTKTPQGIGGIIKKPKIEIKSFLSKKGNFFYLAGLQDPGNVGAIVRVADAFNFKGVIYEKRGASPFNEKSVRASAGSILRVPVIEGDVSLLSLLKDKGFKIFFLNIAHKCNKKIYDIKTNEKNVFVFGQEGKGIDLIFDDKEEVYIPMRAGIDSLNVAVSAGILAFYITQGRFNEKNKT